MNKIFPILFFIFSSYFYICNCNNEINGEEKVRRLNGRILNGIIPFDSQLYKDYIIQNDRPYHFFILLTATAESYKCDMCKKIDPEFTVLAESYIEAINNRKTQAHDGLPIFYGVAEHPDCPYAFSLHGFSSIPMVMYVSPNHEHKPLEDWPKELQINTKNLYNPYLRGSVAESLKDFVNEKTGAQFKIERSRMFLFTILFIFLGFAVIAFKIVVANWNFILKIIRQRKLWLIISYNIYGLSIAGMLYCIIREPPLYHQEPNGKLHVFSTNGRQQFVLEGLLVGGYNIGAAIGCILLSEFAPCVKDSTRRYIAICICLGIFILSYKLLFESYKYKNPWYAQYSWI